MSTKSLYIMTVVAVMACASGGASGGASGSGSGSYRNPSVITEQEIAASHESNGFDVVQKLRPMFLKTRGRSTIYAAGSEYANVFVDGQFYGDLPLLRNLVASQIREIHYLNDTDGAAKYGIRYGSGVIDVRMK